MSNEKPKPKPMPPEIAEGFKKLISGGGLIEMTNMFGDLEGMAKQSLESNLRQEQWLGTISSQLKNMNNHLLNIHNQLIVINRNTTV